VPKKKTKSKKSGEDSDSSEDDGVDETALISAMKNSTVQIVNDLSVEEKKQIEEEKKQILGRPEAKLDLARLEEVKKRREIAAKKRAEEQKANEVAIAKAAAFHAKFK